ncbi:hypothetical protein [Leifsonia poae]|uniref:hypothetical protein n=1 Tax=Leifsonia poae TaxID=110933 RepID=UPI003D67CABC
MTDRDERPSSRLGYELGAQNDDEAREFEDTATELALTAEPVTPPASLKADLFAKLAATPQLPRSMRPKPLGFRMRSSWHPRPPTPPPRSSHPPRPRLVGAGSRVRSRS